MKKICFFDIDGTLSDDHLGGVEVIIPDSCKEALRKAKEEGHLLFVNSGRVKSTILFLVCRSMDWCLVVVQKFL